MNQETSFLLHFYNQMCAKSKRIQSLESKNAGSKIGKGGFWCIMYLACLLENKLEFVCARQHDLCSINTFIVKVLELSLKELS